MRASTVWQGRRPPLQWRSPNPRRVAAASAGLDADAEAYITAVGGLDATHTAAINTYVLALKAAGVWTKIGRRYLLANENATAARTDLKTAGDLLTVNGAPVFAADAGYTGDALSDWLTSTYNPTGSGLVTQDDCHMMAVDATVEAFPMGTYAAACGLYDGDAEVGSVIMTAGAGAGPEWAVNTDGFSTGAAAASNGIWHASRVDANETILYRNGAQDTAAATASEALPDATFTVLAQTAAGANLCAHQIRVAGIGAGLTPAEVAADATATEAYLDAIGAGVVA